MEIYAVSINHKPISDRNMQFLTEYLFEDRKGDVTKYKQMDDRKRTLMGHLLLKIILSQKLNKPINQIVFSKSQYGKPYVENSEKLYFNLSHSGNWCIGIFSDSPVGIDIEQMEPFNLETSEYFFHPNEVKQLKRLKGREQLEYFYQLWTMKESYVKAVGKGLSLWSKELTAPYISEKSKGHHQFIFDKHYMVSICKL